LIGGGFLRSAAVTAAGTAGGALVFEGIWSIFGLTTLSALLVTSLQHRPWGDRIE
jgi:hypothetical protein